jgi:hypothetical protein
MKLKKITQKTTQVNQTTKYSRMKLKKKTQLKRDKKKTEATGLTQDPSHKIVITPYKANKKKL